MFRINIIILISLVVIFIGQSFYFSSKIISLEKNYKEKKELINNYNSLKQKYSKNAIKKEKTKVMEFLDIFDIKYSLKKSNIGSRDILSMELKKSTANKVISYILNSNINIGTIEIKKLDQYTIYFEVSLL